MTKKTISSKGYGEVTTKLLSDELSMAEKEALFKTRKSSKMNFADLFDTLCQTAKNEIKVGTIEKYMGPNTISRYKSGKRIPKRSNIIQICFALRQEGAVVTADDVNAMLEIFGKRKLNSCSSVDFYVTVAVSENMNLDELLDYLDDKGYDISDLDKPEVF